MPFAVIKISLLLLSICFSLNISAKTEYYELVDSAEVNIKEKRWDRAESFLKELLRSYPDDNNNSLIISNLATVQRYQGKVSEAIRNYSFAINMTPNAVTLLKNRASLYLEVDSVARALSDYDRILSLDEKDEESRYYHGILSLRVGNLDEAKLDFDYILYYNPASGLGREGLAHYNKIKKDYIAEAKSEINELKLKTDEEIIYIVHKLFAKKTLPFARRCFLLPFLGTQSVDCTLRAILD